MAFVFFVRKKNVKDVQLGLFRKTLNALRSTRASGQACILFHSGPDYRTWRGKRFFIAAQVVQAKVVCAVAADIRGTMRCPVPKRAKFAGGQNLV